MDRRGAPHLDGLILRPGVLAGLVVIGVFGGLRHGLVQGGEEQGILLRGVPVHDHGKGPEGDGLGLLRAAAGAGEGHLAVGLRRGLLGDRALIPVMAQGRDGLGVALAAGAAVGGHAGLGAGGGLGLRAAVPGVDMGRGRLAAAGDDGGPVGHGAAVLGHALCAADVQGGAVGVEFGIVAGDLGAADRARAGNDRARRVGDHAVHGSVLVHGKGGVLRRAGEGCGGDLCAAVGGDVGVLGFDRQAGDLGVPQNHGGVGVDGDLVVAALQDDLVAAVVDHHGLHAAALLGAQAHAAVAGLADEDAAHLGAVDDVDGIFAAAADHQAAADLHVVDPDVAVGRALTHDQVALHSHVLEGHAGGVDHAVAGQGVGVGPGGLVIAPDQIVHDLGKFRPGDAVQGIQLAVAAVDIAVFGHGGQLRDGPGADRCLVRKAVQGSFVPLGQLEGPGQHGEGLLPGDGVLRPHFRAVAVEGAHAHGLGDVARVPSSLRHVGVDADVLRVLRAEGAVDDGGHLGAGELVFRGQASAGALQQAVVHSGGQSLVGPVAFRGHVRKALIRRACRGGQQRAEHRKTDQQSKQSFSHFSIPFVAHSECRT